MSLGCLYCVCCVCLKVYFCVSWVSLGYLLGVPLVYLGFLLVIWLSVVSLLSLRLLLGASEVSHGCLNKETLLEQHPRDTLETLSKAPKIKPNHTLKNTN